MTHGDEEGSEAQLDEVLAQHDPDIVRLVLQVQLGAAKAKLSRLQWAESVEALAAGVGALCPLQNDWRVRRGSVAANDRSAPRIPIGSRSEPFADLLRYEAALNMRIAADHMQGFAALLRAERSLLGSATLARGIFESCTWAAALLDPHVPQVERLRRLLMRRIVRMMADIRERELLSTSNPQGAAQAAAEVREEEDEHGSHLDPATEIEDLVSLGEQLGFTIKRRLRSIDLDTALSIDWLVKNLGQSEGVEPYVWGNGSSLAHGEHGSLTVSLAALVQDDLSGNAPGWMVRLHSTGSWAGPRLLLATFAAYTGRNHLLAEFEEMARLFWDNSLQSD